MKPLKDRVVLKQIAAEEKTSSGIILPDEAKEKPEIAEVISVGKEVKEVKPKDKVVYSKYSGTEIKYKGTDYLIVKEEDILAVVE